MTAEIGKWVGSVPVTHSGPYTPTTVAMAQIALTAMARVKQDLLDDLRAYGLADSIGPDRLFPTLPTALAAYQSWSRDHH